MNSVIKGQKRKCETSSDDIEHEHDFDDDLSSPKASPSKADETIFSMPIAPSLIGKEKTPVETPSWMNCFVKSTDNSKQNPDQNKGAGKTNPTNQRIRLEHRTSLRSLVSVNKSLAKERSKFHLINEIGFGAMARIEVEHYIQKGILAWLINSFDPDSKMLNIHDYDIIHITPELVGQALGIPACGLTVSMKSSPTKRETKWDYLFVPDTKEKGHSLPQDHRTDSNKEALGRKSHMKVTELANKLSSAGFSGDEYRVMYLVLLFSTILFPGSNCNVNLDFISIIEDVEQIREVNWAELVLAKLCDGVQDFKDNKQTYVTGCIFILVLLFFKTCKSYLMENSTTKTANMPYVEQISKTDVDAILNWFRSNGLPSSKEVWKAFVEHRTKDDSIDDELEVDDLPGDECVNNDSSDVDGCLGKMQHDQWVMNNNRITLIENHQSKMRSTLSSLNRKVNEQLRNRVTPPSSDNKLIQQFSQSIEMLVVLINGFPELIKKLVRETVSETMRDLSIQASKATPSVPILNDTRNEPKEDMRKECGTYTKKSSKRSKNCETTLQDILHTRLSEKKKCFGR